MVQKNRQLCSFTKQTIQHHSFISFKLGKDMTVQKFPYFNNITFLYNYLNNMKDRHGLLLTKLNICVQVCFLFCRVWEPRTPWASVHQFSYDSRSVGDGRAVGRPEFRQTIYACLCSVEIYIQAKLNSLQSEVELVGLKLKLNVNNNKTREMRLTARNNQA